MNQHDDPQLPPRLVFGDVETTGLGPGAEVIEITVLDEAGRPLFDSLIRPSDPYGYIAEEIHGITASQLAAAPSFGDLASDLRRALDSAVLVCHNAEFDTGMIFAAFAGNGLPAPSTAGVICTMTESAQLLRLGRRISLTDAMTGLHVAKPLGRPHRAGFDAECTRRLWNCLRTADVRRVS